MKQGCFTEIPYTKRLRKLRGTGLIKIAREAFSLIDRNKCDLTNYDRSWMYTFG